MESGKQLPALFLVILLLGLAGGQSRAADDSLFEVTGAHTAVVYEVYVVDANIRMRLTKHAREALQNGVPLEILVEVEVLRERPWLWNETIEHIRKTYRLSYHALSERYIVKRSGCRHQRELHLTGRGALRIGYDSGDACAPATACVAGPEIHDSHTCCTADGGTASACSFMGLRVVPVALGQ